MIRKWLIGILSIIISLSACKNKDPDIITYDLVRKNFSEKIISTGALQSANNFTIVAPRVYSPFLKVTELLGEGIMAVEGDTICKLEASDISGYYDRYIKEVNKAKADLIIQEANNELQLSSLESQLKEIDVKAEYSSLDSVQLKFAPAVQRQILELELKKSEILQQKILKKLEAQKKINEQTIRALKSQIVQKEQLTDRFQEQLDMLTIVAPKPGMVVHSTSPTMFVMMGNGSGSSGGKTKVGSSVFMDMPLVELPDLDSMQIVLMLPEADYKRINKGQKVVVKPESLKGQQTTGTVKSKSMASSIMSYQSKVKSYEIIVDIDSLDNLLLPGLSAHCEIVVQDIQDTIAVPSISIFEKDSCKIVYVLKDSFFEIVKVKTSLTNGSETIVTEGLKGTETIALMEPSYSYILKPKNSDDE